jgi:hypothetical protein
MNCGECRIGLSDGSGLSSNRRTAVRVDARNLQVLAASRLDDGRGGEHRADESGLENDLIVEARRNGRPCVDVRTSRFSKLALRISPRVRARIVSVSLASLAGATSSVRTLAATASRRCARSSSFVICSMTRARLSMSSEMRS